jgi:hypothetical protein
MNIQIKSPNTPRAGIAKLFLRDAGPAGWRTTLWKQLLSSSLSKHWELMRQSLIAAIDIRDVASFLFFFLFKVPPAKDGELSLKGWHVPPNGRASLPVLGLPPGGCNSALVSGFTGLGQCHSDIKMCYYKGIF